jgi:catechol 2,3-dioxygenase-like lactoylglutathione lyase family enzyme
MSVLALDHCTVLSADLAAAREFYCDVLGLEEGSRPDMGFDGLWLYAGGRAIVHIVASAEPTVARNTAIDHIAFRAGGLSGIVERMRARGLKHSLRRRPEGGWQLFCRDPQGALIELDFAADEPDPAA